MPDQQPDSNVEKARITYALWLAVSDSLSPQVLVPFFAPKVGYDSKDIAAIVGLFTGVLGTLAGAFFGRQIYPLTAA